MTSVASAEADVPHLGRGAEARATEEQPVAVRETVVVTPAGHDGDLGRLGDSEQEVEGAIGVVETTTGVDQRIRGAEQRLDDQRDGTGVGVGDRVRGGGRRIRRRHLITDVLGDRDDHRTGPSRTSRR